MFKTLYNIAPYSIKCAFATAYGLYLNHVRYDKNLRKRVNHYLERETWTAKQWDNWQNETLGRTLYNAKKWQV